MEKIQVHNRDSLTLRLIALKAEREKQEVLINNQIEQIGSTLQNPGPFIKRKVSELAADQYFRSNLLTIFLNAVTKYFMRRQSGSSTTKSSLVEKLLSKFTNRQTKEDGIDIIRIVKNIFS